MSKRNTYYYSMTCILLGLSGCLVDEDSIPPTYIRTTDTLHIYESGDFLSYTVSGTNLSNSSPISGELVVRWSAHNDLAKPLNKGGLIPVLQETTTLTINTGPVAYNDAVVRYISQEDDIVSVKLGTLRVHAFEDAGEYLWLNNDGDLYSYEAIEVLLSPITKGQTPVYTFFTLAGCDGKVPCDVSTAQIEESYQVKALEKIVTDLGKFEAYKINISNLATNYLNGADYYLYDIRHFCANVNADTLLPSSSNGTIWIFPEIGIVKYKIFCTNPTSGESTLFTASLNHTNIELPPSL